MPKLNVDLISWLKSKHINISKVNPNLRNISLDSALFEVATNYSDLFKDFLNNVYNVKINSISAKTKDEINELNNLRNLASSLEQENKILRSTLDEQEQKATQDDKDTIIRNIHDVNTLLMIIKDAESSWEIATEEQRQQIEAFITSAIKSAIDKSDTNVMREIHFPNNTASFKKMINAIIDEIKEIMRMKLLGDPKAQQLIAELSSKITESEEENLRLRNSISNLNNELSILHVKMSNNENDKINDLQTRLNNSLSEIEKLRGVISSLNTNNELIMRNKENEIDQLKLKIDSLTYEVANVGQLKEQIDRLTQLNKELNISREKLINENSKLSERKNSLLIDVNKILDDVKKQVGSDLTSNIDELKNKCSQLVGVDEMNNDIISQNKRLNVRIEELEKVISGISNSGKDTNSTETIAYLDKINELNQRINDMENTIKEKDNQISQFNSIVHDKEQKEQELIKLQADYDELMKITNERNDQWVVEKQQLEEKATNMLKDLQTQNEKFQDFIKNELKKHETDTKASNDLIALWKNKYNKIINEYRTVSKLYGNSPYIKNALEAEIRMKNKEISELKQNIVELSQQRQQQLKQQRINEEKAKNDYQNQLEVSTNAILELNKIKALIPENTTAENEIIRLKTYEQNTQQQITELNNLKNTLKDVLGFDSNEDYNQQLIQLQNVMSALNRDMADKTSELTQKTNELNGIKNALIEGLRLDKNKDLVEQINRAGQTLEGFMNIDYSNINDLRNQIEQLGQEINRLNGEKSALQQAYDLLQTDYNHVRDQLEHVEHESVNNDNGDNTNNNISSINEAILNQQINQLTQQIEQLEADKETATQLIQQLEAEKTEKTEEAERVKRVAHDEIEKLLNLKRVLLVCLGMLDGDREVADISDQEISDKINSIVENNVVLGQKVHDLEVEKTEKTEEVERLMSEYQQYKDEAERDIMNLKHQLERLESEKTTLNQQINQLNDNRPVDWSFNGDNGVDNRSDNSQDNNAVVIEELKESLRELEQSKLALVQQLEQLTKDYDNQINSYKQQLQRLESEKTALNQQLKDYNKRNERLESEKTALNQQLEQQTKDYNQQLKQYEQDVAVESDKLKARINQLEQEKNNMVEELKQADNNDALVVQLKSQIDKLQTKINELEQAGNAATVEALNNEIVSLTTMINELMTIINGNSEGELIDRFTTAKQNLDNKNKQVEELNQQIEEYKQQIERLNELNQQLNQQIEGLNDNNELVEKNKQIDQLNQQLEENVKQIDQLNKQIETLKNSLVITGDDGDEEEPISIIELSKDPNYAQLDLIGYLQKSKISTVVQRQETIKSIESNMNSICKDYIQIINENKRIKAEINNLKTQQQSADVMKQIESDRKQLEENSNMLRRDKNIKYQYLIYQSLKTIRDVIDGYNISVSKTSNTDTTADTIKQLQQRLDILQHKQTDLNSLIAQLETKPKDIKQTLADIHKILDIPDEPSQSLLVEYIQSTHHEINNTKMYIKLGINSLVDFINDYKVKLVDHYGELKHSIYEKYGSSYDDLLNEVETYFNENIVGRIDILSKQRNKLIDTIDKLDVIDNSKIYHELNEYNDLAYEIITEASNWFFKVIVQPLIQHLNSSNELNAISNNNTNKQQETIELIDINNKNYFFDNINSLIKFVVNTAGSAGATGNAGINSLVKVIENIDSENYVDIIPFNQVYKNNPKVITSNGFNYMTNLLTMTISDLYSIFDIVKTSKQSQVLSARSESILNSVIINVNRFYDMLYAYYNLDVESQDFNEVFTDEFVKFVNDTRSILNMKNTAGTADSIYNKPVEQAKIIYDTLSKYSSSKFDNKLGCIVKVFKWLKLSDCFGLKNTSDIDKSISSKINKIYELFMKSLYHANIEITKIRGNWGGDPKMLKNSVNIPFGISLIDYYIKKFSSDSSDDGLKAIVEFISMYNQHNISNETLKAMLEDNKQNNKINTEQLKLSNENNINKFFNAMSSTILYFTSLLNDDRFVGKSDLHEFIDFLDEYYKLVNDLGTDLDIKDLLACSKCASILSTIYDIKHKNTNDEEQLKLRLIASIQECINSPLMANILTHEVINGFNFKDRTLSNKGFDVKFAVAMLSAHNVLLSIESLRQELNVLSQVDISGVSSSGSGVSGAFAGGELTDKDYQTVYQTFISYLNAKVNENLDSKVRPNVLNTIKQFQYKGLLDSSEVANKEDIDNTINLILNSSGLYTDAGSAVDYLSKNTFIIDSLMYNENNLTMTIKRVVASLAKLYIFNSYVDTNSGSGNSGNTGLFSADGSAVDNMKEKYKNLLMLAVQVLMIVVNKIIDDINGVIYYNAWRKSPLTREIDTFKKLLISEIEENNDIYEGDYESMKPALWKLFRFMTRDDNDLINESGMFSYVALRESTSLIVAILSEIHYHIMFNNNKLYETIKQVVLERSTISQNILNKVYILLNLMNPTKFNTFNEYINIVNDVKNTIDNMNNITDEYYEQIAEGFVSIGTVKPTDRNDFIDIRGYNVLKKVYEISHSDNSGNANTSSSGNIHAPNSDVHKISIHRLNDNNETEYNSFMSQLFSVVACLYSSYSHIDYDPAIIGNRRIVPGLCLTEEQIDIEDSLVALSACIAKVCNIRNRINEEVDDKLTTISCKLNLLNNANYSLNLLKMSFEHSGSSNSSTGNTINKELVLRVLESCLIGQSLLASVGSLSGKALNADLSENSIAFYSMNTFREFPATINNYNSGLFKQARSYLYQMIDGNGMIFESAPYSQSPNKNKDERSEIDKFLISTADNSGSNSDITYNEVECSDVYRLMNLYFDKPRTSQAITAERQAKLADIITQNQELIDDIIKHVEPIINENITLINSLEDNKYTLNKDDYEAQKDIALKSIELHKQHIREVKATIIKSMNDNKVSKTWYGYYSNEYLPTGIKAIDDKLSQFTANKLIIPGKGLALKFRFKNNLISPMTNVYVDDVVGNKKSYLSLLLATVEKELGDSISKIQAFIGIDNTNDKQQGGNNKFDVDMFKDGKHNIFSISQVASHIISSAKAYLQLILVLATYESIFVNIASWKDKKYMNWNTSESLKVSLIKLIYEISKAKQSENFRLALRNAIDTWFLFKLDETSLNNIIESSLVNSTSSTGLLDSGLMFALYVIGLSYMSVEMSGGVSSEFKQHLDNLVCGSSLTPDELMDNYKSVYIELQRNPSFLNKNEQETNLDIVLNKSVELIYKYVENQTIAEQLHDNISKLSNSIYSLFTCGIVPSLMCVIDSICNDKNGFFNIEAVKNELSLRLSDCVKSEVYLGVQQKLMSVYKRYGIKSGRSVETGSSSGNIGYPNMILGMLWFNISELMNGKYSNKQYQELHRLLMKFEMTSSISIYNKFVDVLLAVGLFSRCLMPQINHLFIGSIYKPFVYTYLIKCMKKLILYPKRFSDVEQDKEIKKLMTSYDLPDNLYLHVDNSRLWLNAVYAGVDAVNSVMSNVSNESDELVVMPYNKGKRLVNERCLSSSDIIKNETDITDINYSTLSIHNNKDPNSLYTQLMIFRNFEKPENEDKIDGLYQRFTRVIGPKGNYSPTIASKLALHENYINDSFKLSGGDIQHIRDVIPQNLTQLMIAYNSEYTDETGVDIRRVESKRLTTMSFVIQILFWMLVVVIVALIVYFVIKFVQTSTQTKNKAKRALFKLKTSRYI